MTSQPRPRATGPAGYVNATVVLAGIASATRLALVHVDDDVLLRQLVEAGRRALGLRAPRRPAPATSPPEPDSTA